MGLSRLLSETSNTSNILKLFSTILGLFCQHLSGFVFEVVLSLNYEADLILLSDSDSLISGKQLWLLNIHNQTKDTVENSLPYVKFHLKNGETLQRFIPQEDDDFLQAQKGNNIVRFLWDDNSLLPWYSKRLLVLTEVISFDQILMLEVIFDKERILIPFWDNFLDFQDFKN